MALIPRWQFMTDEAKTLTKRLGVSALLLFVSVVLLRAMLPWVIAFVVCWWIWKAVRR